MYFYTYFDRKSGLWIPLSVGLSFSRDQKRSKRMEYLLPLVLITIVCITIHVLISTFKPKKTSKYPPGPRPLPIIGNILDLGNLPHQKLAKLYKIYGPTMCLKLGSTTTIVISSPHGAKEVVQKHDQIFSNKTIPNTGL